jgi:hypothetical protein
MYRCPVALGQAGLINVDSGDLGVETFQSTVRLVIVTNEDLVHDEFGLSI